jgi:autoinducer 2-degrading protein
LLVQVRVKPEERERFVEAIRINATASVRDEPDCLRFDVSQEHDDPDCFLFYEVYRDAAAFEAHRRTTHFAQWRLAAAELLVEDSQVNTPADLLHSSPELDPA